LNLFYFSLFLQLQMLSSVEHVSLKVFNRDAAVFSDSSAMRRYAEKASAGLANVGLTQKENGLMAAIILFSAATSNVTSGVNPEQVTSFFNAHLVGGFDWKENYFAFIKIPEYEGSLFGNSSKL
jgi:hypothetical protein